MKESRLYSTVFLLFLFLSFGFYTDVKATTVKEPDPAVEQKLAEKAKEQSMQMQEIIKYYQTEGLAEENILSGEGLGYFYFSEDGESIIFQKPKQSNIAKNTEKALKIKKVDKVTRLLIRHNLS